MWNKVQYERAELGANIDARQPQKSEECLVGTHHRVEPCAGRFEGGTGDVKAALCMNAVVKRDIEHTVFTKMR